MEEAAVTIPKLEGDRDAAVAVRIGRWMRSLLRLPAREADYSRRGFAWSGLGLAMSYARGASGDDFRLLVEAAGRHWSSFAQSVAFGCEAWSRSGHVPEDAKLAASAVGDGGADDLAGLVRRSREDLPADGADGPGYEVWRRRVAASLGRRWPPGCR
jgi:hypothetical protein